MQIYRNTASDFVPCIYTWSYYKRTDQGIDWSNVKNSEQLTVNQVNAVESENNKFEPAGKCLHQSLLRRLSGNRKHRGRFHYF